MSSEPEYYEHYRAASIGTSLMDALNDLVESNHIPPQLAVKVLSNFDRAVAQVLASDPLGLKVTIKGHLHTFNRIDEVYYFVVTDAKVKVATQGDMKYAPVMQVDRLRIVTCKAAKP